MPDPDLTDSEVLPERLDHALISRVGYCRRSGATVATTCLTTYHRGCRWCLREQARVVQSPAFPLQPRGVLIGTLSRAHRCLPESDESKDALLLAVARRDMWETVGCQKPPNTRVVQYLDLHIVQSVPANSVAQIPVVYTAPAPAAGCISRRGRGASDDGVIHGFLPRG